MPNLQVPREVVYWAVIFYVTGTLTLGAWAVDKAVDRMTRMETMLMEHTHE